MRDLTAYLKDYDRYHRTTGNKLTHALGIPLIILSHLGLLDRIVLAEAELPVGHLSPALMIWALATLFYLRLHLALGFCMALATGALYWFGTQLSLPFLLGCQILGWVLQGIGHAVYEKKKPAFAQNAIHLIIGPAYLMNYILRLRRFS